MFSRGVKRLGITEIERKAKLLQLVLKGNDGIVIALNQTHKQITSMEVDPLGAGRPSQALGPVILQLRR
jgi:hypothetical protein